MTVTHPADPIELRSSYRFDAIEARARRLPPRGQLRIVSGIAKPVSAAAYSPTLLFSSLLHAPHYHELVLAHYALPASGKHGPFNVADLAPADFREIDPQTLIRRTSRHLEYRRYGAPAIAPALVRRTEDLIVGFAARPFLVYALAPCEAFSRPDNSTHPHEWSHALLEFHEYVLFDRRRHALACMMFAFD